MAMSDIIIIIALIVGAYLLYRIAKAVSPMIIALIFDYVVDFMLSLVDEAAGGLFGLDWGDWIAAVIIFVYYSKQIGKGWSLFAAWEATNFLPISFIPGVDILTGMFPAVTAIVAQKSITAGNYARRISRHIEIIEAAGEDAHSERAMLKELKDLIDDHRFKDATDKGKEYIGSIEGRVKSMIRERLMEEERDFIEKAASGQISVSSKALSDLRNHWQRIEQDIEQGRIEEAEREMGRTQQEEDKLLKGMHSGEKKGFFESLKASLSQPVSHRAKEEEKLDEVARARMQRRVKEPRRKQITGAEVSGEKPRIIVSIEERLRKKMRKRFKKEETMLPRKKKAKKLSKK